MHITKLTLRNFRNFKNAQLQFKDGINTIIGENGSGKTNLFFALRILLDGSLPRNFEFNEGDFNRTLSNWRGHWIMISISFKGFKNSPEIETFFKDMTRDETDENASCLLCFRPRLLVREKLHEYSLLGNKDKSGLEKLQNTISIADYETVYFGRNTCSFNDENDYDLYIGNFSTIDFPNPNDQEGQVFGTKVRRGISLHNDVSCTFIKALRDVSKDLQTYHKNPLLNLLKDQEGSTDEEDKKEIIDSVDNLNSQINSLEQIRNTKNNIEKVIQDTVGNTYAPNIDIRSELPDDMQGLFKSLKLWVGDPNDENYAGRIWELSLGGANLIYLSLKLLEYQQIQTDRIANFLLIEEPEAHIHTHIQKTLFKNLKNLNTQLFVSTHSTHISSTSKISSVNILHRQQNETLTFYPAKGLTSDEVMRAERYLDAIRSDLLFAKGCLLVEGDAEQILIPAMFQKVFGISLDEIGISLINISGIGFNNIAHLFHPDRIQKHCAIITDLDTSIIEIPDLLEQYDKELRTFQEKCKASQESGANRKKLLDELCFNNRYLKPFYAEYTFEVDMILNDNEQEFVETLNSIYSNKSTIKESTKKLETCTPEIAGREALRIAKQKGKGWFAILLSEQLYFETVIPKYILEAILFASHNTKPEAFSKSCQYRLNLFLKDPGFKEEANILLKKKLPASQLVSEFCAIFPDDQLSYLISL